MNNNYFDKTIKDTLDELNIDSSIGLTETEVLRRIEKYGENKLQGKKEKSLFIMFIDQFKDFLVIILIVAAIISLILGILNDEGILDAIIIFAIVIINAVLGMMQENKASNALKALKEMSSPQSKVLRDNKIEKINTDQLVPGDIVILEAGDYIPADVRLIDSMNLKVDESALTGESVPSEKFADKIIASDSGIGDRINCCFMGTIVTYGRGRAVVTSTGMQTETGKIARMLNETEEEITPLQKLLDKFGKTLGIACIIICIVVFILGIIENMKFFEIFMLSIALAVAAIPEGLTIVVTVILAIGMQKMVKKNAIIKKLSAVETLGSTTVICSDKTGTLTQNKMTVVKLFDLSKEYEITGTGYSKDGSINTDEELNKNVITTIIGGVLCNDSIFNIKEEKIIGDPTEGALIVLGEKLGFNKEALNNKYNRINEIPFDSSRKLMSTFHKMENGKFIMYTKGALDEILLRSKYVLKNDNIVGITNEDIKNITITNENYADKALRVLGVAYREFDNIDDINDAESELVLAGLFCMIDPPRIEAKEAIATCKKAGIVVKMITGDHKITAKAIAVELGITEANGMAIDGKEINNLSDEMLKEKVKECNVYARVSPEHKVKLVTAIKSNKNIVAMTGDGVNDAPSLKKADIGIAMGITGTDVSKEASDMILTDDNFASIVSAIEEGRTIYNNIRKVIGYLVSCNIGEILLILFTMLIGLFKDNFPVLQGLPIIPLAPVHLLSINLVTDAFPAFALGMEEKEEGVMSKKPRDPNAELVDKNMRIAIICQSLALAIGTLSSYLVGFFMFGPEYAQTFCFVTIVFGELLRAYSARSEEKTIFSMKIFSNSYLNKSVLFSLIFLLLTIYFPFFNNIFKTFPLGFKEISIAILFSFIPLLGGEFAKLLRKKEI